MVNCVALEAKVSRHATVLAEEHKTLENALTASPLSPGLV